RFKGDKGETRKKREREKVTTQLILHEGFGVGLIGKRRQLSGGTVIVLPNKLFNDACLLAVVFSMARAERYDDGSRGNCHRLWDSFLSTTCIFWTVIFSMARTKGYDDGSRGNRRRLWDNILSTTRGSWTIVV
ncbi:TRAP transporter, 4TM/12TM fusion protein, partial [Sesbania bispinosa]